MYSLGVTLWFLLTGRRPFRGPQVKVMSAHLSSPPPFDELVGLPTCVVSLLAHMLEKDAARRPTTPAELVSEIDGCIESLNRTSNPGQAPVQAAAVAVPVAPLLPSVGRVSANREPVREHSSRRFVLAELLVGTAIAVIIYLVLSRPVDMPVSSMAAANDTSEVSRIAPPPAGAHVAAAPEMPATASADASRIETAGSTPPAVAPSPLPSEAGIPQTAPVPHLRTKSTRERRSRLTADRQ